MRRRSTRVAVCGGEASVGRPSAATGRVGLSTRRGGLNGEAIGCYRAGGGLSEHERVCLSPRKLLFKLPSTGYSAD